MSDNEEQNLGDKRRPDFMEPSSQKRQKVILEAYVPNNQDLISELTQLGQNLALVADASRVPETEISENFLAIQQEINNALQNAFNQAQNVRKQNEQQRIASEREQMGQEEINQFELLQQNFLQRLQPLTQRMSEQLTYGEQAQMFNIIINSIDTRLNENNFNNSEPNVAALLIELASITYNFALEQLAVTLSNVYQATPDLIRQLTSLIAASGMAYNYLPDRVRSNFVMVPYFGPLFQIMNRINPLARNLQNSAAAVTTIYYLLRNAGIDTTDSIALLGSSAAQLATSCAIQSGRLVCQGVGLAQDVATSIIDSIASRIGDVLTREYQDIQFRIVDQSQESSSTMRSMSSQNTVNTLQSQNSAKSLATVQSISQLLGTPVAGGGISLGNMDGQIVQQRLQAISENNSTILPDTMEETSAQINTQPPSISFPASLSLQESQDTVQSSVSAISTLSEDTEEMHWSVWLFGQSNSGGKRLRKSRRRIGKRKTRRKGKKGKKTIKRIRKVSKTLKRRRM